jgi:hypothetical protein
MPGPNTNPSRERNILLVALVIGLLALAAVITVPEKLGLVRAGWDKAGGFCTPALARVGRCQPEPEDSYEAYGAGRDYRNDDRAPSTGRSCYDPRRGLVRC